MKLRQLLLLLLFCGGLFGLSLSPVPAVAQDEMRLVLTGSRATESLVPPGSSDLVVAGGLATYSLIIENTGTFPQMVDATVTLPPGLHYLPETLRINGLSPVNPPVAAGAQVRWSGVTVPAARGAGPGNLAGVHIFFANDYPSYAEIDQRLAWAVNLVGAGGTIKLFLPGINEHWTAAPEWLIYAVQRSYQLGMRPVVRIGFANGDQSSFTRRRDDPVGQMNRADAAAGYQHIAGALRRVVAHLLAESAGVAATAPSAELTVIIGNEPNLEWVERDWFIDYSYVRQPDGSFDTGWLTTDPADPTAAANSPAGWRLFVRGMSGPSGTPPTYDSRLDDYTHYLGYDAAVEYGRFLRAGSAMLQELYNPRLQVAAGAIASGGGDLDGRYAYHQRHFIRRMLQAVSDALVHVDVWTTNNYPYSVPPWENYHANPADFERYPLGEPFWHTEVSIDAYQGDLDYLAYLQRQGVAQVVPSQAIIGEVGYGIGPGWGTEFGFAPITEDLRARYMSDIFETYYNTWRNELIGVNLWQLGDPDQARAAYHMFNFVYPDSQSVQGWPTHRHLVYDAVATRQSRPGPGRAIITFQARLDPGLAPGGIAASAALLPAGPTVSYQLTVGTQTELPLPQPPTEPPLPPEPPQPTPQPPPPTLATPPPAPEPPQSRPEPPQPTPTIPPDVTVPLPLTP
jgi:uncharacterized repeat protein (TIGR01451 family)